MWVPAVTGVSVVDVAWATVEGGTAGVDTSVGPKRSQVENQVRFAARWAEVVGNRPARPVTARPEDWYAAAIRDRDDKVGVM